MNPESVPYHLALFAGLASFFSPCVLPLIPAYFTFITGLSLEELTEKKRTSAVHIRIVASTLSYVLGFSLIFILLGASASYLSGLIFEYRNMITKVGGAVIILFGIHLTGWLPIRVLLFEKKLRLEKKPLHFLGAFMIGMAFGAGWSPCVGPLLGSILILAGSQDTVYKGMSLLAVYSAGLAIPFILLSIFINFILIFIKKATGMIRHIHLAAGILLIILGLLLFFDKLFLITGV
ncbi:MAG: cytochrome c biogenesis protein CcdA [Desulfobacteraceae bacterium]|nr:MAG: cytochrome c biogenesis protein CcdA [Desulfobacteraceae bacterium]